MAWNGWVLAESVMAYKIPTLGLPEGINHLPLAISGVLIALFSLEHIVALCARRGRDPVVALTILCVVFTLCLMLGVPVAFSIGLSAVATILYEGLPLAVVFQRMTSGHEHLLVPRHPVLHLRRRADALWRRRRSHRGLRQEPGRPCARRPRHGQRRGLHPVRRRVGLAGRRRLGHRRRDDPDDEEGGLPRRLCRQRDHPRSPGRRPDADQPQHDHLFAGGRWKGLDHRPDPGRHRAGGAADDLHAGGRLPGGDPARLPGRHLPGLERRAVRRWSAPFPACWWWRSS